MPKSPKVLKLSGPRRQALTQAALRHACDTALDAPPAWQPLGRAAAKAHRVLTRDGLLDPSGAPTEVGRAVVEGAGPMFLVEIFETTAAARVWLEPCWSLTALPAAVAAAAVHRGRVGDARVLEGGRAAAVRLAFDGDGYTLLVTAFSPFLGVERTGLVAALRAARAADGGPSLVEAGPTPDGRAFVSGTPGAVDLVERGGRLRVCVLLGDDPSWVVEALGQQAGPRLVLP